MNFGIPNNMQEQLRQLQSNPREFIEKAGVKIPEEMMGNPQAMVMHLIQTGQVSSPVMQRIAPMIRMMGGKI